MKTLQYLAAPSSFILLKHQSRRVTSKGSIHNTRNYKPSFAHYTNHFKFNNLQINNFAAVPQIKNKVTEKEIENLDWRQAEKHDDYKKIVDMLMNGRLLQEGLVYQQNFLIRSYDLGPDCKMSIRALINLLQESALNHLKSVGLIAEGFGSTPEMSQRDLIWVVYRMNIVVETNYPSWDDVVEINTWVCASGRNCMQRHWLVHDYNTGKVLFRAVRQENCQRLIEETREEFKVVLTDCDPIIEEDDTKLKDLNFETAGYIRTGLSPQWTDLDVNQHVNHVKYIDWVLESVPNSIVESHKLSSIRLDFRKECGKSSSLHSLCANNLSKEEPELEAFELDHTIRFQDGSEILRGRTMWTPRK